MSLPGGASSELDVVMKLHKVEKHIRKNKLKVRSCRLPEGFRFDQRIQANFSSFVSRKSNTVTSKESRQLFYTLAQKICIRKEKEHVYLG